MVMAHLHFIEDYRGDVVDQLVFCSDYCHFVHITDHSKYIYNGWNGCNEISTSTPCVHCEVTVKGIDND